MNNKKRTVGGTSKIEEEFTSFKKKLDGMLEEFQLSMMKHCFEFKSEKKGIHGNRFTQCEGCKTMVFESTLSSCRCQECIECGGLSNSQLQCTICKESICNKEECWRDHLASEYCNKTPTKEPSTKKPKLDKTK